MIQVIYKITSPLQVDRLDDHLKSARLSRQFGFYAWGSNLRFDSRPGETVGNHRRYILGGHCSNHDWSVWIVFAHSLIAVRVSWIWCFMAYPQYFISRQRPTILRASVALARIVRSTDPYAVGLLHSEPSSLQ